MSGRTQVFLTIALSLAVGGSTAHAQRGMGEATRSLGGYGATTIASAYVSGGGPIPYMANGGGVGLVPAPRPVVSSVNPGLATPIGGSSNPLGIGLSGMRTLGPGRRAYAPLLPMGGGMGLDRASGRSQTSRTSLGFGSPFRQPPSLGGSGSASMP